jgi:hypothetical protein
MNPITVGMIVFACVFGAALLGIRLRAALPKHHLSEDTKNTVQLGMGLVATMAALILGLLVASANGSYGTKKDELMQMAAKIAYLDQVLANYGPETRDARLLLRGAVEAAIARIWREKWPDHASVDPSSAWSAALPKAIQTLRPQDDAQRAFKAQTAAITAEIGQMRWLLAEQTEPSISKPLLIVVIVWLTIIFASVGLFAPSNNTAVAALMLAALSVAGAIFLILELDQPFGGLIQISSQPMRNVLSHLAR